MMSRAIFVALLVVSPIAGLATEADTAGNAAVQKVIQMLGDMSAKCKEEKNQEQVAFAEFETWCKMEIPQTKKAIANGAETIELLQSSITKLTAEAKVLGEEIAKLQTEVANAASEKKAADAERKKTNAAYLLEAADYGESLDAIDRALVVMQKV